MATNELEDILKELKAIRTRLDAVHLRLIRDYAGLGSRNLAGAYSDVTAAVHTIERVVKDG
jgi:hypothetical protein